MAHLFSSLNCTTAVTSSSFHDRQTCCG
uniref:Uncharacterized protein n=1 Tax=Anguilla anguilla TaxID=7936 RepID=A0A0E9VK44_ANGAN